jgi:hypothetical protein
MKSKTSVIATAIAVSGMTLTLNAIGGTDSHLPAAQKAGEVTYIIGRHRPDGSGCDQARRQVLFA